MSDVCSGGRGRWGVIRRAGATRPCAMDRRSRKTPPERRSRTRHDAHGGAGHRATQAPPAAPGGGGSIAAIIDLYSGIMMRPLAGPLQPSDGLTMDPQSAALPDLYVYLGTAVTVVLSVPPFRSGARPVSCGICLPLVWLCADNLTVSGGVRPRVARRCPRSHPGSPKGEAVAVRARCKAVARRLGGVPNCANSASPFTQTVTDSARHT